MAAFVRIRSDVLTCFLNMLGMFSGKENEDVKIWLTSFEPLANGKELNNPKRATNLPLL